MSDDLFSGMLQGISMILKESLNRGNVNEIHLDQGIMLLQRCQQTDIVCVLIATKSTRILRDGLRAFSDRLYPEYSQFFTSTSNVSQFSGASSLVAECFSFVPEYD